MSFVGLLAYLLILLLIFALVAYIVRSVPAFAPYQGIALGIVGLIIVILLLSVLFGGVSVPVLRVT